MKSSRQKMIVHIALRIFAILTLKTSLNKKYDDDIYSKLHALHSYTFITADKHKISAFFAGLFLSVT